MTSHSSVAASVRAKKLAHPELFCANAKCLWQIVTPRGPNPCRNHQLLAVELVPGDARVASFDVPIVEVVPSVPPTAAEIVRAAFASALDGATIDSHFLTLHGAVAAIESALMEQHQRPLMPSDTIQIGIASALEWGRRHPAERAAFQQACDAHEATRPRVVPVLPRIPQDDTASTVTGCDGCPGSAVNLVSNGEHRYHSFRCAPCTTTVVANFALIGAVMRVEPLRRSIQ
jgi:hypothetical protein